MNSFPPPPDAHGVVVAFPGDRASDRPREDPAGAWAATLRLTLHATERMRARRRLLTETEERLPDLQAALEDERRNSLAKIAALEQAETRAEAQVESTVAALALVDEAIQSTNEALRAAHETIKDAAARQENAEAWLRRIQRAMAIGAHDRVARELGAGYDAAAGDEEPRTHRANGATASGAQ